MAEIGTIEIDVKILGLERYFLDQDSSCHWYLVPEEKRTEWDEWSNLGTCNPESWEAPAYARRLEGSPSNVTFIDPQGGF